MRFEVAYVTGIVKYIRKSVFRLHPNFLFEGGAWTSLSPSCLAAYAPHNSLKYEVFFQFLIGNACVTSKSSKSQSEGWA